MQCIKAVEEISKSIIQAIFDDFRRNKLDDSEYVNNIKSVIRGTDNFLKTNNELIEDPEMLKQALYAFAKSLWMGNQRQICLKEDETESASESEEVGYYEYFFDYLYQYGNYPA